MKTTPWDDMPREELLKEVWKFYLASHSAFYTLRALSRQAPMLFGPTTYGASLEMVRQAVEPLVETADGGEAPFNQFLTRYATDLLFEPTHPMIGYGWMGCPTCGKMIGASMGHDLSSVPVPAGTRCKDTWEGEHDDLLVPLTWAMLGRPEMVQTP